MAVDHRQIDAFRLVTLELLLEPRVSLGMHREHDQP